MTNIQFAHPHTLFTQVEGVLKKVGPKKFFSSPNESVKKAREGFAAYFFALALKQYTKRDWWLAQYDQAVRAYPDFDFISFGEAFEGMKLEHVELTGVYPHFKTFDEVMGVIKKKQKQYGTDALKFSLLVFMNHEKSEEWIQLLRKNLISEYPFISVWTIHLRFKKGGLEVGKAVASKIFSLPGLRVEADMDDSEIHKRQPIPNYMEITNKNGFTYVSFKPEFVNKMKPS